MNEAELKGDIRKDMTSNELDCLLEIAETLRMELVDCRNELADTRGWKDGYVLNASDAITCFNTYKEVKMEQKPMANMPFEAENTGIEQ